MAEVMSRSECVWMCESRPTCDDMLTPRVMLCVDFLSMLIHRHDRDDQLNRTRKYRHDSILPNPMRGSAELIDGTVYGR